MLHLIGQAFWLALAVTLTGILHMVVVKARLLTPLALPLDGGRTLGGVPIFGENKTWRGVVVMVAGAALIGFVQGGAGGAWAARSGVACIDFGAFAGGFGVDGALGYALGYGWVNAFLGFGYVLGELPNSFAKRRLRITPGTTSAGLIGGFFFVLDQADSVVVALGIGTLLFGFGWRIFVIGVLCLSGLHLAINAALYLSRVRKNL